MSVLKANPIDRCIFCISAHITMYAMHAMYHLCYMDLAVVLTDTIV